jgi:hypothetical protein
MYPMEGVTMVRTCLIVISEGDTPMICEVSTPKITGFKSLNKNHPGNLKISQVFEIIQKILNWLIFSLLGPGAYGKSLSGEGGLGGGFVWSTGDDYFTPAKLMTTEPTLLSSFGSAPLQ